MPPSSGSAQAVAPTDYGSIEMLAHEAVFRLSDRLRSNLDSLLAAIVGAIALARRTPSLAGRRRARVSRPQVREAGSDAEGA